MRGLFLAATIVLLPLAAAAGAAAGDAPAPTQNGTAQDEGTQRLNEETNARLRQQIEAREQAEARNRETRERIRLENERAQREYQEQLQAREREQQRYNAEMERFRAQQGTTERQATRGTGNSSRTEGRATGRTEAAQTRRVDANRARQSTASTDTCQDQRQRARRRGRTVGGVLGGVAGVLGGRNLGNVARVGLAVASVPVGALIGEAIASRLDCREQQQAAIATEQVTEQAVQRGVGTSVAWQSETRENVSGTTTVTALSTPVLSDANACMTVTDVIIVDGEETRAEKRLCRRPPTNRFVRV